MRARLSISNDGSKIAFYSRVDGDDEIFVINSNGTGSTRLTTNTENYYVTSISGDGLRIAFSSLVDGNQEIYLGVIAPDNVIPEVPLGTLMASATMIISLVA